MQSKYLLKGLMAGVALGAMSFAAGAARAEALTGKVASSAEPTMEGVIVSAKKEGSIVTTSVVSDASGNYAFPADRLTPGKYAISIRATGYDLQGPALIEIAAGKPATADLTLTGAKDVESQLTNAEWINSIPVPDKEKAFLTGCTSCHTLARPMQSKMTEKEWPDFIKLMSTFSAMSTPEHPQPLVPGPRDRAPDPKFVATAAKFLAENNLSSGKRTFPLKPLPRPKGRPTHVIYTTYDLPTKEWWPHDVTIDKDGKLWMDDFGDQFVGSLDLKTLQFEKIALPTVKDDGSPLGNLDLEWGPDGKLWVAGMYQGAIYSVDPKTKEVKTYKLPDEIQNPSTQESFVAPQHSDVDGYVWTTNQDDHSAWRLNLKTGKFEKGTDEKDPTGIHVAAYQIVSDSKNNIYLLNNGGTYFGYADMAAGRVDSYKTPLPNGRPRRGVVDSKDRAWYSEYGANAIGMFDPKTKKLTEWVVPTPNSVPYGLDYSDKFNEAWTGSEVTDKVARLEVSKDTYTEYFLPNQANIRRVYLDNRGDKPVLWFGNNHSAQIVKVEPQD